MNQTYIEAVLFDFDGTLTSPGHLDFDEIRRATGCPDGASILTHIASLSGDLKTRVEAILDEFEMNAASIAAPADGLAEVLDFFSERAIPFGVLTRNTRAAVQRTLEHIPYCSYERFACVITRDDAIPVKPAPDGVIEGARRMGTIPRRTVVVGDFRYDIEAGINAGATTIFIDNQRDRNYPAPDADFVVADLRTIMTLPSDLWRRSSLPDDM